MAWGNKKNTDMNKTQEPDQKLNIIGFGTKIIGDITSTGDLRIEGTLEGNIEVAGKLVVGQSGAIKGTLKCKNAVISGKIEGTLTIQELLEVKASAKIDGEVYTDKLAIEPGALFTGTCSMKKGNNPVTNKPNAKKEPAK